MRIILVILLLFVCTAQAEACRRCGRSWSSCSYKPAYSKPYDYGGTKDIVINNTFAFPYASQGATNYVAGAAYPGAAMFLQAADKTEILAQSAGLAMATIDLAKLSNELHSGNIADAFIGDAESAVQLSKAQVITDALKLLDDSPKTEVHSQTLIIRRDQQGRYSSQVIEPGVPPEEPPNVDPSFAPAIQTLVQTCGRCHSGQQPKAGLLLDGTEPIAVAKIPRLFEILEGIQVPKAMEQVIASLDASKASEIRRGILVSREEKLNSTFGPPAIPSPPGGY